MTRQWIEEVAGTCRAFGTDYLHVIIDQAGVDFSVIPALNSLSVEWQSLFHGLPEAFIVDDAPLVARFTLDDLEQMCWLQDISQQLASQAPLLLFCTYWPFSALANWLTQCMDILQEGRSGILRFYDTRATENSVYSQENRNRAGNYAHLTSENGRVCYFKPRPRRVSEPCETLRG